MQIGGRIRTRRQELKLSLRELADRAGLTASFLSQIERDLASPSIESLRRISEALDVPLFYFLVEPEAKSPVVRRDRRLKLMSPEAPFTYELLTPDLNRKMEVFMAELQPGDTNIAARVLQNTEECIYVLQGQLEIQLGQEVHVLGPGDSVYFEGPLLRRLAARGDQTLRFISAITPPIF
jgi:transcriptional regulator with XRE-family HTH domain